MRNLGAILSSLGVFVLVCNAGATVLPVPGTYLTIQAGIDAAVDGDTVLIADGTYTGVGNREINPGGKRIVIRSENGSASSVIDCEYSGRGFVFNNGEDTTTVLAGLTITHGRLAFGDIEGGGAILCYSNSSPSIIDCLIQDNESQSRGGGLACFGSSPLISGCRFENNRSGFLGGGLSCRNGASPKVSGCVFVNNESDGNGGGVSLYGNCNPLITACLIENNEGTYGGGVSCYYGSLPVITSTVIRNNIAEAGGGLASLDATPTLRSSSISGNSAIDGGGIQFWSSPGVDIGTPAERCNIYQNMATNPCALGDDINGPFGYSLYLDTMTVHDPDEAHLNPPSTFNVDALNAIYGPTAADLYVSPTGDNSNDGLAPATALRSIRNALDRIVSSPVDHYNIHILPGTYGPSTTGDRTLHTKSHVSLLGADSGTTIIDGELSMCLIYALDDTDCEVDGLTLANGRTNQYDGPGGVYCSGSNPSITGCAVLHSDPNAIICDNGSSPLISHCRIANTLGDAVECREASSPEISNNRIEANHGAGVSCLSSSAPLIIGNELIGSGIYCQSEYGPVAVIRGNLITSVYGSAISCVDASPLIVGNTISMNRSSRGGGLYCQFSSPSVDSNLFQFNSADGQGGAVFLSYSSSPVFRANTFEGNRAVIGPYPTSVSQGGAIYSDESSPIIGGSPADGNTFTDNWADVGADLFCDETFGVIDARYNTFEITPVSPYFVSPLACFDVSGSLGANPGITEDVYVLPAARQTANPAPAGIVFTRITDALRRLSPDIDNPLTIHAGAGLYSPSTNGEVFPLPMFDHVSLVGAGKDVCTLDAEQMGSVVACYRADSVTISDLTVSGGHAGLGGGIHCDEASPRILRNRITGNSAIWGGGIGCGNASSPLVADNEIVANGFIPTPYFATLGGGIAAFDESNLTIRGNLIAENHAGDWGGGISCYNSSDAILIGNTIYGNTAGQYGGGLVCGFGTTVTVERTIIWGNQAPNSPSIVLFSGVVDVTCSDVEGGGFGSSNIDENPACCDPTTGRFQLALNSPCMPAFNACGVSIGAYDAVACVDCLGSSADADDDLQVNSCDNCPTTANQGQEDSDADSVGDACDYCPGIDNGTSGCLALSVDVLPGVCPNLFSPDLDIEFRLTRPGPASAIPTPEPVPVAVMGTPQLDVTDLSVTSLTVNGLSPVSHALVDVGSPQGMRETPCECSASEPDGNLDLVLYFDHDDMMGLLGQSKSSLPVAILLTGSLKSGIGVGGTDCLASGIWTLPPGVTSPKDESVQLDGNFPNPFNASTEIEFSLSAPQRVQINVYNILGQAVKTLTDLDYPEGSFHVTWDGTGENGRPVASGVYLYRIEAESFSQSRQMILLK